MENSAISWTCRRPTIPHALSGPYPAARRHLCAARHERTAMARRYRPSRRRRADLRAAGRVERRAVVERRAGRQPARHPRRGEADVQRRRKPRRIVGRFRRRNGRVLRRDARHDSLRVLPAAERLHPGAAAHGARGRAVSRQPPEQAALRRQRRARSAVSHGRGRADARALVQKRRDDYVQATTSSRARHDVVAGGEGRVRGVRPRAPSHALPRNADVGNGGPPQIRTRTLAADRRDRPDTRRVRAISRT